ncbi:hypothetical protein MYAM1_001623 [Malassezia yamatoensis]|uniref:Uncharacterized protein n=1 Tax=Malassezia yamatoensis TaxID=253288 RepID=A0AAJ6CH32_9BASI|nr:hypothetical protein MYAM1_001623 [Malassezia yamatoensis]
MATNTASTGAPPSYEQYLLNQTRQNVEQLGSLGAIDSISYRQLVSVLSSVSVRPPEIPVRADSNSSLVPKTEKEKLKGRNKWTREVLANSDIIPSLVDAALSVAAGPLLSSGQRQSIVQIVSLSQERIANAITDPAKQQSVQNFTKTSAKSAQSGILTGLQNTGQSWEKWNKKRDQEAELQRAQRSEQRSLQAELKRERESFARKSSDSSDNRMIESGMSSMDLSRPSYDLGRNSSQGISLPEGNSAAASVVALPTEQTSDMQSAQTESQTGAVTTTFTPWPGLVLTQTLVATSGISPVQLSDQMHSVPPPAPDEGEKPLPPPGNSVPPPPPRQTSQAAPASNPLPPPPRSFSGAAPAVMQQSPLQGSYTPSAGYSTNSVPPTQPYSGTGYPSSRYGH